jgi:hypothetical protein
VATVDRHAVRAHFERRFTARRMAEDYVRIYRALTEQSVRIVDPGTRGKPQTRGRWATAPTS